MASRWRRTWAMVLGGHVVGAVGWMLLRPGGFPVSDVRTWGNRVAPVVVLGALAVIAAMWWRGKRRGLAGLLVAVPAVWLGGAIGGLVVFPVSWRWPAVLGGLGAGVIAYVWWKWAKETAPGVRAQWALLVAVLGIGFGAALPLSIKGPPAGTRPMGGESPVVSLGEVRGLGIDLGNGGRFAPARGGVSVTAGAVTLDCEPLLTFNDWSPDGCWTIFAPRGEGFRPALELMGIGRTEDGWCAAYRHLGPSTLSVRSDGAATVIDARCGLPGDTYAHLSVFTQLIVAGHRKLAIEFSPCAGKPVDVLPADYPVGRPRRVAYLDARGVFHVAEARSAEKGPFRDLCAGRLGREEALALTFLDEGRPVVRVTFADWAAQADTQLSPTAGWGLPCNAIEFSIEGEADGDPAAVFLQLAGTSVGRGFDSVAHRAGVYRNRVRIEPVISGRP